MANPLKVLNQKSCKLEYDREESTKELLLRTCPGCSLGIANPFITMCPRCLEKLPLANTCQSCFKRTNCH